MKVDLSKALEAVRGSSFADGSRLTSVQVEFQRYSGGNTKLTWKLYGFSSDGTENAWTSGFETFDDALSDLEKELRPKARFVEND